MENPLFQNVSHTKSQNMSDTKSHESHSKSNESHCWFCCQLFGGEYILLDLDPEWGGLLVRNQHTMEAAFPSKNAEVTS